METYKKYLLEGKIKYKDIPVDKNNYKKIRYNHDARLSDLSNEELKARVYHIRWIYSGTKGNMQVLKRMELKNIWHEFMERGIKADFKI